MDRKSRRKRTPSTGAGRTRRTALLTPQTSKEPSETRLKKASLFMNGRSQAVRLPKEFRFEGTHVYAVKDGNRVILSPIDDRIERLISFIGSAPDFPEVPRTPAEPMRPEIKEHFGVSD